MRVFQKKKKEMGNLCFICRDPLFAERFVYCEFAKWFIVYVVCIRRVKKPFLFPNVKPGMTSCYLTFCDNYWFW